MSLVAKIEHFPPQKGDENESRRQKSEFFWLKMVTRKGFVAKNKHFSAQNDDEKAFHRLMVRNSSNNEYMENIHGTNFLYILFIIMEWELL